MRREQRQVLHRAPDPAWLQSELAAADALLEQGRWARARARAEAAGELLPPRACGPRRGSADLDCAACRSIDDAAAALGERAIAARLGESFRAEASLGATA